LISAITRFEHRSEPLAVNHGQQATQKVISRHQLRVQFLLHRREQHKFVSFQHDATTLLTGTFIISHHGGSFSAGSKGKGPFTVFAPTDEAFAKVPSAKLEALLKDKAALTSVLTYHVVPGKVMAADVVKLSTAKTVQGKSINIATKDGKVMINGANVVRTDIVCGNGVIHVIDAVILPPE
jgi:uncharacterized surface protein with fasciclin (FAS1) repeats